MTMYAYPPLTTPRLTLIFGTRLNSRVHIRSRLKGAEGHTIVTITHERVTDRGALTTSKLGIGGTDSGDGMLPMVSRTKTKRTAEKAVGLDEAVVWAESQPSAVMLGSSYGVDRL
jgi:hypothetical protein